MIMKERDWLLENLYNPHLDVYELTTMGELNTSNTQFLDRETYRRQDIIKERFTDQNGIFQEDAFNNAYDEWTKLMITSYCMLYLQDELYNMGFVSGYGETYSNGEAKAEMPEEEIEDMECDCQEDSIKKGMVVVLSANVMGTGDEKLGKALMKAFVFAVTKQDVLPETILCYNTGAYLTCEDSDSLEDFKALEAEGVNIMTCGTCLDFYDIKEKLAVGTVTNMYDIVAVMEGAKSLIRP